MSWNLFLIFVIIIATDQLSPTSIKSDINVYKRKPLSKVACIKRTKSRILYYSNTTATFNLILSGDVESNPGPGFCPKCAKCEKTVNKNHKRLVCSVCRESVHAKCIKQFDLKTINARTPKFYTCNSCLFTELPFAKTNLSIPNDAKNDTNVQCQHKVTIADNKNKLSIAHLNTQSLCSSFAEFTVFVNNYDFDIITVSETWLKNDKLMLDHVKLEGYEVVFRNREDRRGGGVAIYVKSCYKFKLRKDIMNIEPTIEHVWIELSYKNKNSGILLGACYQDNFNDTSKAEWLNKLDNVFAQIKPKWDSTTILCGDMNINTLNKECHSLKLYQAILEGHGLKQHIIQPTRQRAILDHIITNIENKVKATGVIPCPEISDHDCVYTIIDAKAKRFQPRFKIIRSMKNFDKTNFIESFSSIPLTTVYAFDDPSDQVHILDTLILQELERHAPLRRIKVSRPCAPWLKDLDTISLQQECREFRFKCHQTGSETDWKLFRQCRNKLKSTIRRTKRIFYRKALSSKRPKEIWQTIHRILDPNKKRIDFEPDKLNSYYTTMAQKLTGKPPTTKQEIEELIDSFPSIAPNITPFKLQKVTYDQVVGEIRSIRNDCSTGADNIPIDIMKLVADIIASPLTTIINNSIEKAVFPDQWKIGKVCPIPKIDNPTECKDFRPISILPIFSKIFERIIMRQLTKYIEDQSIYSITQSGFRKHHSTNTLLLKIRDDILNNLEKGEVTVAVLTDYSKAFDTVDYPTLVKKLHSLNFSKNVLKLITSYLTGRLQYVQIDDKLSPRESISFGVPQGSILGPILFNIYVSDMKDNCENCTCVQYADDSNIYKSCKPANVDSTIECVQKTLNDIYKWSKQKNLLFNPDKTKFMIFTTNRPRLRDAALQMCPDENTVLNRTESSKVLGVQLQQQLNWDVHLAEVTKSCYSTIAILRKLKNITNKPLRKKLAEALILSKIDYCNTVFDPLSTTQQRRLQKVINSAAAFVLRKYASTNDAISLGWLPVPERTESRLVTLCHQTVYRENFPSYMKLEVVKKRLPRACNDDGIKVIEKGHKHTFSSRAAKLFNQIPRNIREIKNEGEFKNSVKKHFMNKARVRLS